MRASLIIAAGFLISAVGCTSRTPEIGVTSSDFDLNPLVGEWRGNYSSAQTGRTGTIAFTLRAGEGSASGNVVMIPRADSLLTPAEREAVSNVSSAGRKGLENYLPREEGGKPAGTVN